MADEPVIVAPPDEGAVAAAGEGAKEVAEVEAKAAVEIAKVNADAAKEISATDADVQKTAIAAAEQENVFRKGLEQCQANIANLTEQTQANASALQSILSKLTQKEPPPTATNPSAGESGGKTSESEKAPEPQPPKKRRLRLI